MTLLDKIKAVQLQCRKNRQTVEAAVLTTLIGEASMVGKNNGNRESTDLEVISTIKKFINNSQETLKVVKDAEKIKIITDEIALLTQFLPKQYEGEELERLIDQAISTTNASSLKDMKLVMNELRSLTNGQYDGKHASSYVKTKLGS